MLDLKRKATDGSKTLRVKRLSATTGVNSTDAQVSIETSCVTKYSMCWQSATHQLLAKSVAHCPHCWPLQTPTVIEQKNSLFFPLIKRFEKAF
jgi:hypothetical protein